MSRPNPFQRHETPDEESERVPLAASTPEPEWPDERDLGDEQLPSYREAVAQGASRRAAQQQASSSHVELPPPFEPMVQERPAQRSRSNLPISTQRLQGMSFCLLLPVILLVAGSVFRSFRNSMTLICSGINFVNAYSNPTPPGASSETSTQDKEEFFLWVVIMGLIAYPLLFMFLLFKCPRIFGLPPGAQSRLPIGSRAMRNGVRRTCISVCCGLSMLYFAAMIVTIWGVIHLANARLMQNFVSQSTAAWVGNYVTLEKTGNGSIGYLCSPTGARVGNISHMGNSGGWTLGINGSQEGFDTIFYVNATNFTPITFNATCRAPNGNGTSSPCLNGGLVFKLDPITNELEEYEAPLNMTIVVLNNSPFLNASSNATVGTTNQYYQGIGQNYAPLGLWFQGSSPLLQVLWFTNSTQACAGLRINFPKENEVLAWPVLGLIWEWWIQWEQNGNCS